MPQAPPVEADAESASAGAQNVPAAQSEALAKDGESKKRKRYDDETPEQRAERKRKKKEKKEKRKSKGEKADESE